MMRIVWILSFIVASHTGLAAQSRGVSYIGACHEKVRAEDLVRIFEKATTPRLHVLLRTFNPNGCPSVRRFIKDARPLELHLSLLNGPGLRNRRLQPHEFLYGYDIKSAQTAIKKNDPRIVEQIKAAAKEAQQLIAERGSRPIIVRIKPCLECDFDKETREQIERIVRPILPGVTYIDNPLRDTCLKNRICEKHGAKATTPIQDLDGEDYDTIEQLGWTKRGTKTTAQHTWKLCANGFKKDETWIPPLRRMNFCGGRDITEFQFWVTDNALTIDAPLSNADTNKCKAFTPGFDGVKTGFVWKLGDGRAAAVTLLPLNNGKQTNYKSVEVVKNGKVFDRASSRGRYRHDPENHQRQIFQFTKHTVVFPDNAILRVDDGVICVRLEQPQFRID